MDLEKACGRVYLWYLPHSTSVSLVMLSLRSISATYKSLSFFRYFSLRFYKPITWPSHSLPLLKSHCSNPVWYFVHATIISITSLPNTSLRIFNMLLLLLFEHSLLSRCPWTLPILQNLATLLHVIRVLAHSKQVTVHLWNLPSPS